MAKQDTIVIIGAGIIGLDVAFVLAERGLGSQITIVAEYMPGDTATNYTSPWAGCNFSAISGTDANALKWDKLGYAHLMRLATECPAESYVERTPSVEYWQETVPHEKIKHMADYLEDFKVLPSNELPEGVKAGITFTAVTINAPKHCEYLQKRLEDLGVKFFRQRLPNLAAGFISPSTRLIFNCTGLAAKTLPGVKDEKVFPTRGQVVLVRAPTVKQISMLHGNGFETYIIPRPGSNGNVILGGYMQKGVGDGSTYSYETKSILERTIHLDTKLQNPETEVLAAFAGMRPSRTGGARIEGDSITVKGQKKPLVHNYGAGGTGYQAGYGSRKRADTIPEKHALIPNMNAQLGDPDDENEQLLRTILEESRSANAFDAGFHSRIADHLNEAGAHALSRGWKERFAEHILRGVECIVETERKMGIAMGRAYDKAHITYKDFAKEHPVWDGMIKTGLTIIAIGILAEMLPWALEWLGFRLLTSAGFSDVGPVMGSFAARWMSMIAKRCGNVPAGSMYSYLQRLGMVWRYKPIVKV
ncbi:D-amino-acid oxidase-like protein [Emericellopsis cladophorae]|uniref:D-amino-acid oxidase-like protein n=1 Tax=Emericellopsis cladophorae TaxID=2686198 RepID=A0A9P9Y6V6_9HYPO|nr:D-amino-acid oxidase-like protein [Emericellopsis cladophorae]KAI6784019.1 D-amino-acid oxidase-like protein [Emericellopsis cladophorae]